ncbi:hypothetical protein PCE1_003739 [Barthelona sp. PCE]
MKSRKNSIKTFKSEHASLSSQDLTFSDRATRNRKSSRRRYVGQTPPLSVAREASLRKMDAKNPLFLKWVGEVSSVQEFLVAIRGYFRQLCRNNISSDQVMVLRESENLVVPIANSYTQILLFLMKGKKKSDFDEVVFFIHLEDFVIKVMSTQFPKKFHSFIRFEVSRLFKGYNDQFALAESLSKFCSDADIIARMAFTGASLTNETQQVTQNQVQHYLRLSKTTAHKIEEKNEEDEGEKDQQESEERSSNEMVAIPRPFLNEQRFQKKNNIARNLNQRGPLIETLFPVSHAFLEAKTLFNQKNGYK